MGEGKFWVEIWRLAMARRRTKRARVNRDVHVAGNAASWEEQRGWNRRFILGAEWPADLERMIRARQCRTSKAQQGGLCLSLQAKGS